MSVSRRSASVSHGSVCMDRGTPSVSARSGSVSRFPPHVSTASLRISLLRTLPSRAFGYFTHMGDAHGQRACFVSVVGVIRDEITTHRDVEECPSRFALDPSGYFPHTGHRAFEAGVQERFASFWGCYPSGYFSHMINYKDSNHTPFG